MILRFLFASCLTVAALTLSACGFHLPDEVSLAQTVPALKVSGNWHNSFFRKTVDLLRVHGVKVYTDGYGDDGVNGKDPTLPELSIPTPRVSTPLVSVNVFMSALEYNLIVSTADILKIPGHRPLLMKNSLTRTYLNKSGKALATSNEFQEMLDETYDELASQLVMRISYLGRQSDPDSEVLTPAQLTESKDNPQSKIKDDAVPAGVTLMDALRYQNEKEISEGKQYSVSDLNNGSAVLNSQEDRDEQYLNRSYSLPKINPKLKDEAPEINDEDF